MEFITAVAAEAKYDVVLKDAAGDVVTSANVITAVSSDDTVAAVTVDPSFTFVTVSASGKVGMATVTVSDVTDSLSAEVTIMCSGVPTSLSLVLAAA
jgi:hypothetical protein